MTLGSWLLAVGGIEHEEALGEEVAGEDLREVVHGEGGHGEDAQGDPVADADHRALALVLLTHLPHPQASVVYHRHLV